MRGGRTHAAPPGYLWLRCNAGPNANVDTAPSYITPHDSVDFVPTADRPWEGGARREGSRPRTDSQQGGKGPSG